jgi:hypothetical protein
MSKYYIGGAGWETRGPGNVGRRYYPNGVLIDDSLPQYAHLVVQGPPIDAIAADQSTYNKMIAPQSAGGMGYPVFRVQYHISSGVVPAAGAKMPAWYFEERNIDGTAVVKRA